MVLQLKDLTRGIYKCNEILYYCRKDPKEMFRPAVDKIIEVRKVETREVGYLASSEANLRKEKKERLSNCYCQTKLNCWSQSESRVGNFR